MSKPELEFHLPVANWQPSSDGVAGVEMLVLSEDAATGAYTGLLRYARGVDTSPVGRRVHSYGEEVYILSGTLTDLTLNQTFSAGMYACRPPGMPHGPWRSETGVTMLEIRYP